jgi:hypothetical protein
MENSLQKSFSRRVSLKVSIPLQTALLLLLLLSNTFLSSCARTQQPPPTPENRPGSWGGFPIPPTPAAVLPTHTRQVSPIFTITPVPSRTPSPTISPTATLTASPTSTQTSSPTPSPTASFTPEPLVTLQRLTSGGCCPQPFWDPGGQFLLYVDRPDPYSMVGLWRISAQGGEAEFFAPAEGVYSSDLSYLAFPSKGQTFIERVSDGQMWMVPAGGREVSFSPDNSLLAWTAGRASAPLDSAYREVWISSLDGSEARAAAVVFGGGFAGWFPDGRLLLSGRGSPGEQESYLWALSPISGELQQLGRGFRLRSAVISPDGSWLAYQSLFSNNPEENGIWLVNTYTLERRRIEPFGAFQWAGPDRLLLVPIEQDLLFHRLLEVRAGSGEIRPLTDPLRLPFKIANGDWAVSPTGNKVVFLSAEDNNLWLLDLGE